MPFAPAATIQTADFLFRHSQGGGGGISIGGPEDKAAKEKDRQTKEETKRLRMVLKGFGMPEGQAEAMSLGEAKGVLDVWAQRHAQTVEAQKASQTERAFLAEMGQQNTRAAQTGMEIDLQRRRLALEEGQVEARRTAQDSLGRAFSAALDAGTSWSPQAEASQGGGGTREGAAARAFLQAGGAPEHLPALGKLFETTSPALGFTQGPNGEWIMTSGNSQPQVLRPARDEAGTFATQEEALAAGQAAARTQKADVGRVRTQRDPATGRFYPVTVSDASPASSGIETGVAKAATDALKAANALMQDRPWVDAEGKILAAQQAANAAALAAGRTAPFPEVKADAKPADTKPKAEPAKAKPAEAFRFLNP